MRHFITTTILGALLLLAGPAFGQGKASTTRVVTALDGVALTASASDRTFAVSDTGDAGLGGTARAQNKTPLNGFLELMFYVDFTHDANGALAITCTAGPSSEDNDYVPTTCSVTSGVCTLNFGGVLITPTLSADKKFAAGPLRIAGHRDASCILSHDGTPIDDEATLKYTAIAR